MCLSATVDVGALFFSPPSSPQGSVRGADGPEQRVQRPGNVPTKFRAVSGPNPNPAFAGQIKRGPPWYVWSLDRGVVDHRKWYRAAELHAEPQEGARSSEQVTASRPSALAPPPTSFPKNSRALCAPCWGRRRCGGQQAEHEGPPRVESWTRRVVCIYIGHVVLHNCGRAACYCGVWFGRMFVVRVCARACVCTCEVQSAEI